MTEHKHLNRLDRIWIRDPVFFVTNCSYRRQRILANEAIVSILVDEWRSALDRHGWAVGRYVVMPDHVHFFCAPVAGIDDPGYKTLSVFMQQWKQWTSKRIIRECPTSDSSSGLISDEAPVWQFGFFDHLLRSQESYRQKWDYVTQNPIRAGLVKKSEDWLWQGEINEL